MARATRGALDPEIIVLQVTTTNQVKQGTVRRCYNPNPTDEPVSKYRAAVLVLMTWPMTWAVYTRPSRSNYSIYVHIW